MISDSIAKLNICQFPCIMSIRQEICTQYCPNCQTKCLSICFALQFAKLNVRQMHRVCNTYLDHDGQEQLSFSIKLYVYIWTIFSS